MVRGRCKLLNTMRKTAKKDPLPRMICKFSYVLLFTVYISYTTILLLLLLIFIKGIGVSSNIDGNISNLSLPRMKILYRGIGVI